MPPPTLADENTSPANSEAGSFAPLGKIGAPLTVAVVSAEFSLCTWMPGERGSALTEVRLPSAPPTLPAISPGADSDDCVVAGSGFATMRDCTAPIRGGRVRAPRMVMVTA